MFIFAMSQKHLSREYYLKRAVQCYEQAGDARGAAEVLAAFGNPVAGIDAARRFMALGDLAAAGEAFLDAGQPRAALDCFRRAQLPDHVLTCLQALGDHAAAGALLLEQGRTAEAVPLLQQALVTTEAGDTIQRAIVSLQLARALGELEGQPHYRAGLALLATLPATAASIDAWLALAVWGEKTGRQDRIQEGYAQALRLIEQSGDATRRQAVAGRYRAAAEKMGNRSLAEMIDVEGKGAAGAVPLRGVYHI